MPIFGPPRRHEDRHTQNNIDTAHPPGTSIAVPGRVILWTHHQTTALLRTSIDRFDDVDEFLFVFKDPVKFVVVTSPEIAHHMLVTEEEHDSACIVQLVHGFEVRNFVKIAEVDDLSSLSICSISKLN